MRAINVKLGNQQKSKGELNKKKFGKGVKNRHEANNLNIRNKKDECII